MTTIAPDAWINALFPSVTDGTQTLPPRPLLKVTGPSAPSIADDKVNNQTVVTFGPNGQYNSTWTQSDWYVDWTNGNDANDGSSGHPVKTIMGGIVPKWGTLSPLLPQDVTFHVMNAQASGGEKIVIAPVMTNKSSLGIMGTPHLVATITLGTTTPKNRSTKTELQAVGFTGYSVGQLVVNTTRGNSAAIIRAITGDVATFYQPLDPLVRNVANVYTPIPTEIDTWQTGDSVSVYDLPIVNILEIDAHGPDQDASKVHGGYVWIDSIRIPDQSGTPGTNYVPLAYVGGEVVLQNCWLDPYMTTSTASGGVNFVGCHFAGGGILSNAELLGGGCAGAIQLLGPAWVDADFVAGGGLYCNGMIWTGYTCVPSGGQMFLHPNTSIEIRQNLLPTAGVMWGAGTLHLQANTSVIRRLPTTNWVSCLNVTTIIFPSSATTGTSYAGGVWTDGIALTSANLDTYHGLQDPRTGARICEDL